MRRERKYNEEKINNSIAELREYRLKVKKIDQLSAKREELRDRYCAGVAVYEGTRVEGGELKNRLVEIAIKWADLDTLIKNEERVCEHLRWCIEEKLRRLTPLKAQVLTLYYLKCYDIYKIADVMYYSEKYIRYLKRQALQEYGDVVL